MKGLKVLGIVLLFSVFLVPTKAEAYVLAGDWSGGSNKILRYNQPGTKHSLQVAHADIHWNKQSPGTIQRMDNAANIRLYDYYSSVDGRGGTTNNRERTIRFNDYWMIRTNHIGISGNREEYSFNVATHEFGHALGLHHDSHSSCVMYDLMNPKNNLPTADDKAGLLASKKRW